MAIILAVTFALKLLLAFYFSHLLVCQRPEYKLGFIAIDGGDTFSYLGAIDNLLESGRYFFWNGSREVYAGRMPYYGVPYFLLRLLLSPSAANDVYVILQIMADAAATVVLARMCREITGKKTSFWLVWLFYFCSFNFAVLSIALWTESLSLSFTIFFLYACHRFHINRRWKDAFWASVFLALLTVIKPYFVIIYPIFLLSIFFTKWRQEKVFDFSRQRLLLGKTAMLGLPLIILLSPWIVRNAVVLGKFIPAQEDIWAGYNYSESYLAFANFAGAWGGGSVPWDATDAGCYFLIQGNNNCSYSIPEYALTDGYSLNEIESVRQNFIKLQENYSPQLDAVTAAEFVRLSNIYRNEQPFRYYIGAKFVILKKLFWHTNNSNLPINPGFKCFSSYQLSFKVIQFAIYFLALTLGSVGLIEITVRGKISLLFILIALVTILFFLELRTTEQRYLNQIFPLLLIGLTAIFSDWKNLIRLSIKKILILSPKK